MKILYIAPLNSVHAQRWITYFAEKGYDVQVIDSSNDVQTRTLPAQVKIHRVDRTTKLSRVLARTFPYLFERYFRWAIKRIIRFAQPHIVHVHYLACDAAFAIDDEHESVVLTAWGSDVLVESKSKNIEKKIRKLINAAVVVTHDAEHLRTRLVELGAKPNQLRRIGYGVDTSAFSPGKDVPSLHKFLGLTSPNVVIISTRALKKIYDVETLLFALSILQSRGVRFRAIIVGEGDQRTRLESLAKRLKLSPDTIFLGSVSDEELISLLRLSDIYVSTSLSDGGIAQSTAEAMSVGLPVVITNFGENSEWIENGAAGRVFDARAHLQLADHLDELISAPILRRKLGIHAREIIIQRNDRNEQMKIVEELYAEIIRDCIFDPHLVRS